MRGCNQAAGEGCGLRHRHPGESSCAFPSITQCAGRTHACMCCVQIWPGVTQLPNYLEYQSVQAPPLKALFPKASNFCRAACMHHVWQLQVVGKGAIHMHLFHVWVALPLPLGERASFLAGLSLTQLAHCSPSGE